MGTRTSASRARDMRAFFKAMRNALRLHSNLFDVIFSHARLDEDIDRSTSERRLSPEVVVELGKRINCVVRFDPDSIVVELVPRTIEVSVVRLGIDNEDRYVVDFRNGFYVYVPPVDVLDAMIIVSNPGLWGQLSEHAKKIDVEFAGILRYIDLLAQRLKTVNEDSLPTVAPSISEDFVPYLSIAIDGRAMKRCLMTLYSRGTRYEIYEANVQLFIDGREVPYMIPSITNSDYVEGLVTLLSIVDALEDARKYELVTRRFARLASRAVRLLEIQSKESDFGGS